MTPFQRGNRRRRPESSAFKLPDIDWVRLGSLAGLLVVVAGVWIAGRWALDRPIEQVVINGEFKRVSADGLEAALRPWMGKGFMAMDLVGIRKTLEGMPWVAEVRISRHWPGTLEINVMEEEPAARWGQAGLLNPQGRLFVARATHIPAELPRLSGPAGTESQVASRYVALQEQLVQRGLSIVSLDLDERGAWSFRLNSGLQVRLGSEAVDQRIAHFYRAFDDVVAAMAADVAYVDMRYTNGFSLGWKRRVEPGVVAARTEVRPRA
jgi:cell division protein FtsQ